MAKSTRGLVLLLAVLLVCACAYVGIRLADKAKTKREEAASEAAEIHVGSVGDAAKLSYTNGGTTLSFTKSSGKWSWDDDADFPLNDSNVASLSTFASGLTATREFEAAEDLANYGLDGSKKLSVTDASGSTLSLLLGNKCSDGETCYAQLESGGDIYTVADSVLDNLAKGIYDMVTLDTISSASKDSISTISLEMGGKTVLLEQVQETVSAASSESSASSSGSSDSSTSSSGSSGSSGSSSSSGTATESVWYVTVDGGKRRALADNEQTTLSGLTSLVNGGLRFSSCVDYKADDAKKAANGLDAPALILKVRWTKSGSSGALDGYELDFGSKGSDGTSYYAMLSDSAQLNLIVSSSYDTLSTSFGAFAG